MPSKRTWYILNKDVTVSGIFAKKIPKISKKGTVVYTENEKASSRNLVKVHSLDDGKSSYSCEKGNLEKLSNEADAKWLIAVSDASDRWSLFKDETRWRNRFLMAKDQKVKVKKLEGTQEWVSGIIRSTGNLRDKKGTWIQVETSKKEDGAVTRHTISAPLSHVQINEQKWSCPDCTTFNLPYRPGCTSCDTARPENYVIPEDYIPTEEELKLIESLNQEVQELPEESSSSTSVSQNARVIEAENPTIKVKLYIEDRFETEAYIVMELKPSYRLDYVKRLLYSQLNLPPEVQCWMVKERVPQDFATLRESGICNNGDIAHIYIKVPKTGQISNERPELSEFNKTTATAISPTAPPFNDLEQDDVSRALEDSMRGNSNEATMVNLLRVQLELEDRECCGVPLFVDVSLTDTFAKMKENIERKWQIQRNWQRLLVGNIAPKDNETVQEYGIETLVLQNQPIFLYVKNPRITQQTDAIDNEVHQTQSSSQVTKPVVPKTSGATATNKLTAIPSSSRKNTSTNNQNQAYTKKAKSPRVIPVNPAPRPSSTRNRPKSTRPTTAKRREDGWVCEKCTFRNLPLRPGCEQCGEGRPATYVVPQGGKLSDKEQKLLDQEKQAQELMNVAMASEDQRRQEEAQQNYAVIHQASTERVTYTREEEECAICIDTCPPGQGVRLKECLHVFCKDCLGQHIKLSTEAAIPCPDSMCQSPITEAEIKEIVSEDIYRKYLNRSLQMAEGAITNSFHCKTTNCIGWCVYEDRVNTFECPVCKKANCLTCKVIHEGMNCRQYQDQIVLKAKNNKEARATQLQVEEMLRSGEAMNCPSCKIVVQKKEGCDWMECTMCKTELCWATRGPRWGPKGRGDTSGGCRCRVRGKYCHPQCQYCH